MNTSELKMKRLIDGKWLISFVIFSWVIWQTTASAQPIMSKEKIYQAWPKPLPHQAFKEVRYDALLDIKSRYEGEFKTAQSQGFTIQYLRPIQGSLSLNNQIVTINFPSRKMQISLNQLPELAQFLRPIKALLYGDPKTVESQYHVSFSVLSEHAWQLSYLPKTAMPWVANHLVVTGRWAAQRNQVDTIRLEFASGDWREFELIYDD